MSRRRKPKRTKATPFGLTPEQIRDVGTLLDKYVEGLSKTLLPALINGHPPAITPKQARELVALMTSGDPAPEQ